MNEYLATVPFDLYQLHLFHLVLKHRSFTRASQIAGLTQSAITRQIQAMEARLGLPLVERTTRAVQATPAGGYLFRESARLLGDIDATLTGIRQQFLEARKGVRVGVSSEVGLAYLPGFFHRNLRLHPEVSCSVIRQGSDQVLARVLANELDLGVLSAPKKLPPALGITHRFQDGFTLVVPAGMNPGEIPVRRREFAAWGRSQNWLLPDDAGVTGQRLREWMKAKSWTFPEAMALDDFDLIINLVALGMGCAFVPVRSLAIYGRKRTIRRIHLRERFERELVVIARRRREVPAHLTAFIEGILF